MESIRQLTAQMEALQQQQEEQRQGLTDVVQRTVADAITGQLGDLERRQAEQRDGLVDVIQRTVAAAINELRESLSGQLTSRLQSSPDRASAENDSSSTPPA